MPQSKDTDWHIGKKAEVAILVSDKIDFKPQRSK